MTDQETVVIRPFRTLWASVVLAVLLVAVFAVVGALLRGSKTGVIFEASDQIAMAGIGVLLGLGALLFATSRVRADAEGIEVRNVFPLTKRYSWLDVIAVSFPDGASFARLELPDDEYLGVLAIQAVDRDRAVEAVRTLRRLHKAAWADQP
jgi:hypothetical protein